MKIQYLEMVTPNVDEVCAAYVAALGTGFSEPAPELGGARTSDAHIHTRRDKLGVRDHYRVVQTDAWIGKDDVIAAFRFKRDIHAFCLQKFGGPRPSGQDHAFCRERASVRNESRSAALNGFDFVNARLEKGAAVLLKFFGQRLPNRPRVEMFRTNADFGPF